MNANKTLNRYLILLFGLLIISCSSDDDSAPANGGNNGGGTTPSGFFNLASGNWWTYDVTQAPNVSRDSLYVNTSSISGGNTVYTFGISPQSTGLMSLLLSQSEVFEENEKLTASGSINLDFLGLTGLGFDIANAVIYDANTSNGTTLFSDTGSFTQNIQGFDLQFNYEITTVQGALLPTLNVNGTDFQNVLQADIIINLEIVAGVFPIAITIMQSQDVILLENYYAEGIGLIKSDNNVDYQLEDLSGLGITLPIPQSANLLITQDIDQFLVN